MQKRTINCFIWAKSIIRFVCGKEKTNWFYWMLCLDNIKDGALEDVLTFRKGPYVVCGLLAFSMKKLFGKERESNLLLWGRGSNGGLNVIWTLRQRPVNVNRWFSDVVPLFILIVRLYSTVCTAFNFVQFVYWKSRSFGSNWTSLNYPMILIGNQLI